MDIGSTKKIALQRINEYSNNGNLISDSTNKDYTLRMNGLINDAQFEIAQIRKIRSVYPLPDLPDLVTDNYNLYNMPSDFMEAYLLLVSDEEYLDHKWIGNVLYLSKEVTGSKILHYYKYPTVITDDTTDETNLEIDIDTQFLIPFYVGGNVIFDENPQIAQNLLVQYGSGMSRIKPKQDVQPVTMKVE